MIKYHPIFMAAFYVRACSAVCRDNSSQADIRNRLPSSPISYFILAGRYIRIHSIYEYFITRKTIFRCGGQKSNGYYVDGTYEVRAHKVYDKTLRYMCIFLTSVRMNQTCYKIYDTYVRTIMDNFPVLYTLYDQKARTMYLSTKKKSE